MRARIVGTVGAIVVSTATLAGAALVHNTASLTRFSGPSEGDGIDIESNIIRKNAARDVVKTADTVDLTYGFDALLELNGCGWELSALHARDQTYEVIGETPADLSKSLDLGDTLHYRPRPIVASIRDCYEQQGLPSPDPRTPPSWYIARTKEGRYFAIRILSEVSGRDSVAGANTVTARVEWYLQTDGSLNFAGAPLAVSRNTSRQLSLRADAVTTRAHTQLSIGRSPSAVGFGRTGLVDCRGRFVGLTGSVAQRRSQGMYVQRGASNR